MTSDITSSCVLSWGQHLFEVDLGVCEPDACENMTCARAQAGAGVLGDLGSMLARDLLHLLDQVVQGGHRRGLVAMWRDRELSAELLLELVEGWCSSSGEHPELTLGALPDPASASPALGAAPRSPPRFPSSSEHPRVSSQALARAGLPVRMRT